MSGASAFRIVQSSSGAVRVDAAAAFLRGFPADHPVNIVAFSRGAADDLARAVAVERGATFGVARYSLTQIAARGAAAQLAGRGIAPSTALGGRAVAARATFDGMTDGMLDYFAGVAGRPGFPVALAATLDELRTARVPVSSLHRVTGPGVDLARLLERAEGVSQEAATADRADLLLAAAEGVAHDGAFAVPLLLLDVAVSSRAEERFVGALIARATHVCVTLPVHIAV